MMNVYFPPAHPTTFLTKIFLDLAPFLSNSTPLIVGGDFNLMLNPLFDKFPHSTAPPSPQANVLHALCEEFGFIDAWRCTHPSDKQYTFFSALHKCQNRIDYFYLPKTDLCSVLSCNITSIIISDHARVIMDLNLGTGFISLVSGGLTPLFLKMRNSLPIFLLNLKHFWKSTSHQPVMPPFYGK